MKGVLESTDKNAVPFEVKSVEQVYSGVNEGITIKEVNGKVIVTIVEMYPTPGYTTNVDKIFRDSTGEYEIYLSEKSPKQGSIQLQVITYKVIDLEIDATNLGEKPYTFKTVRHSIFTPSINQLYK
ncbi:hypothetical protein [Anaerosalibacter sp. Marseille-P3206]|uniref:hypothetical protein n=1 Tax=Anaerosalibacter sp. Marseille-P3206 TaxID=1871005 RepID=UPI00135631BD|nr:hypothetical protein [Anaerosalibacter sp. Marseille-P3206]